MPVMLAPPRATLADLARVDGKAELVAGVVVPMMATGFRPGVLAGRIVLRLNDYAEATGRGVALGDNVGFAVPELSTGRESFSPDAAYYTGPVPADLMHFVPGPPDLAVEVRSDGDYGPAAEVAMAAKRAEYFESGTRVVWDVDPLAGVVRACRPGGGPAGRVRRRAGGRRRAGRPRLAAGRQLAHAVSAQSPIRTADEPAPCIPGERIGGGAVPGWPAAWNRAGPCRPVHPCLAPGCTGRRPAHVRA